MHGLIVSLLAHGIWVAIVFIIVGFVALVKGADWLVDGASAIAKRFGISDLIIGLTVVAFGTSMPEFVVNMVSVGHGTTELAITNILGSNIINTFVIRHSRSNCFGISDCIAETLTKFRHTTFYHGRFSSIGNGGFHGPV